MAKRSMTMLPPLLGNVNMEVTTVRRMIGSRTCGVCNVMLLRQTDDEFMEKLKSRKYDVRSAVEG